MPQALIPIFSAIGSALTAVGGALAAGTVFQAVVLVGSLALSAYQKRKAERAAKAQYDAAQVDRLVNLPSSVAQRELVLGRVRKGGTIVFRGTTGAVFNSQLFVVVAIAAHEIDAVEQIFFNEQPIEYDVTRNGMVTTPPYGGKLVRTHGTYTPTSLVFDLPIPTVETDHVRPLGVVPSTVFCTRAGAYVPNPRIPGSFTYVQPTDIPLTVAGNTVTLQSYDPQFTYSVSFDYFTEVSVASVKVYLGTPDQAADPLMQAAFPPGFWTSQHRGRGIAYIAAQFIFDENAFPNGPPNITARIRGARCYDPRDGVTRFTENPALQMLHVLTHPQFGKRTLASMTAGELARISVAANACDTPVNYGDGQGEMFRSSIVLPFGTAARDACDDLAQAMGGSWAYAAGEFYVRAGVWQAPVMALTERDLAVEQRSNDGSVSQQAINISVHRPRNDKINTVVARIWDESANYVQTPLPPLKAADLIAADGAELSQEVNMPAVFNWRQAMHVASIMLRDDRDPLTVTLPFKMTAYPLEMFDSVTLTLARYGWVNKEFNVQERRFTVDGVLLLTLKETSAAIYQIGAPIVRTGYASNTQLPQPWNIQPPTITLVESGEAQLIVQADGTIVNGVKVSIAAVTDPAVNNGGAIEFQWKATDASTWQSVTTTGDATSVAFQGPGDLVWIAIRARCRSSLAVSDWSQTTYHQVIGKSEPPPELLNLSISGSVLSWQMPFVPPDLAGYVFRFQYGSSSDWNSAAPLHEGVLTESPYDLVTRPGGVVSIMGKAIDTSGNVSRQAALVVMNLGDPPIANILEQWDFHVLGWPGAPADQSGWTLVGGLPTANALDSFYGSDDQSFYRADADSFYKDETYAELVYVTDAISVVSALAGSIMTLEAEYEGLDLRIDYRLAGPGPFYGDDGQPFYGPDDESLYGAPGAWQPWPGQVVVARDSYQFRVRLGAGAQQGVLQSLVMTIDAPDLEEEVPDLAVSAAGTAIPYTKAFTAIKTVQVTLQANGSGAVTTETDKTLPLAPKVRAFNSAHTAVSGATVDITLKGY